MDKNNKGITLIDLFNVIKAKKILFLIVSVVSFVSLFLILQFGISKGNEEYCVNYDITFENIENNKYPDGTNFIIGDIITYDNLSKIKNEDPMFSDVDINLLKDGGISIVKTNQYAHSYSITANKKAFKNSSIAKSFLIEVAKYPLHIAISPEENIDYSMYINNSSKCIDYVSEIELLVKQKEMILDGYDSLITEFGAKSTKKRLELENKQIEAKRELEEINIEALALFVKNKGIVKSDEFIDFINSDYVCLEAKKESNIAIINSLTNAINNMTNITVDLSETTNKIYELTLENEKIKATLKEYDNYLNASSATDSDVSYLTSNITSYKTKLTSETEKYKELNVSLHEEENKITFSDSNILTTTGGISIVVELVISLLMAIIIASVVNIVIGLNKYAKEKNSLIEDDKKEVE